MRSRNVASDSGPRLMMSPANHSGVAALGAALASRRWNASRQPWISPNASGRGWGTGEKSIKRVSRLQIMRNGMLRWTFLENDLAAFRSGQRGWYGGHFVDPALH